MTIALYDPKPTIHDYLSPMYFQTMREYARKNGINLTDLITLEGVKDSIVCLNADYLKPETVSMLKNNGNKIVGFSVTDSSYVSQCCREAKHLQNIDLMFMLTGLQLVNHGMEMIVTPDFQIALEDRQFLPDEDWAMFASMRKAGRLQSLPYVHAERQPLVPVQSYNQRSQKALIRGGHHMRRFILALKLMEIDKLDINSGFVTEPYFQDWMNPQFRYCDHCRAARRSHGHYPFNTSLKCDCKTPPLSDLGQWNNASPRRFYEFSERFLPGRNDSIQTLMNARWLTQQQHLEMLARITFTSDLKWLFSIYAAQRFWDAAMVGCINVLPCRTQDQDYFPVMNTGEHYKLYAEDIGIDWDKRLNWEISEKDYNATASAAKALYDNYMRPTDYAIGTPILKQIFDKIEEHTS